MEGEKYEINFKGHLANLSGLITTFVYSGCVLFAVSYYGNDKDYLFILMWLFGGFSIVNTVLTVPLHINYYLTNKNDKLYYYADSNCFVFQKDGKRVSFKNSDINSVDFFRAWPSNKGNIKYLGADSYSHVKIFLKDGTVIIITSLLIGGNIELPSIDKDKIHNKINYLYRWVSAPSLTAPSKTMA